MSSFAGICSLVHQFGQVIKDYQMFCNLLNISKANFYFLLLQRIHQKKVFFFSFTLLQKLNKIKEHQKFLGILSMVTSTETLCMDGGFFPFNHGRDFFLSRNSLLIRLGLLPWQSFRRINEIWSRNHSAILREGLCKFKVTI